MGPKDTLLTTKEFASRSGHTVDQVTRMLREKQLKGHKQSGRWMISADQLKVIERDTEPDAPKTAPAKPSKTPSPAPQTMTIAEFSARTYLTEAGVVQWLQKGRLKGGRTAAGDWQIDAASLELPGLKHLLRS